jgi:hypothetical protein
MSDPKKREGRGGKKEEREGRGRGKREREEDIERVALCEMIS